MRVEPYHEVDTFHSPPMLNINGEQSVDIVSNERDSDLYFRLVVRAAQIAPLVQPGQFAHVRILPLKDALLRRPFSIFQVSGGDLSILYKAIGRGYRSALTHAPRRATQHDRPIGHGFTVPPPGAETPLLVAGGYAWPRFTCWRKGRHRGALCSSEDGGAWIFSARGVSCARLGGARHH